MLDPETAPAHLLGFRRVPGLAVAVASGEGRAAEQAAFAGPLITGSLEPPWPRGYPVLHLPAVLTQADAARLATGEGDVSPARPGAD